MRRACREGQGGTANVQVGFEKTCLIGGRSNVQFEVGNGLKDVNLKMIAAYPSEQLAGGCRADYSVNVEMPSDRFPYN